MTKAADGSFVSQWLRELAMERISEPPPPVIASGDIVKIADEIFAPTLERLANQPERLAEAKALVEKMASQMEEFRLAAEASALKQAYDNTWELVYKFASYVRHDAGCPEYPCACSIQPIAVELGTARGMAKSRGR